MSSRIRRSRPRGPGCVASLRAYPSPEKQCSRLYGSRACRIGRELSAPPPSFPAATSNKSVCADSDYWEGVGYEQPSQHTLDEHALGCDGSSKLSGPLFRHHQRPVRRNHESNVTRFHDSATRSINSGTWRPAARSAVLCSQGRCKANARRAASVQLWLDIVPHIVVIVLMPMVRGKPGNS